MRIFVIFQVVPAVAKLARLSCVFLCSSDLFLERPVQKLTWGLFRLLTRSEKCLFLLHPAQTEILKPILLIFLFQEVQAGLFGP